MGAKPLMPAAAAGNAPLVEALLAKGADAARRDEFGHTAWDHALGRAKREPYRYLCGFFADQLHGVLQALPPWLWADARRKRSYVNQVLARAEVHSRYQPARRLWVRMKNGHYFPNPQMQLRSGDAWQPVYEQLALAWIDSGCGREIDHLPRPAESIQWVREALALAVKPEPVAADPEGQRRLF